ncbi:MAG: SsrA-binding protein SmpB [Candidatus Dojkabacteria bacterium]|nr:SsrA-binding protein SmpB [Candidatus Dojkabacteria bacterium]
MKKPDNTSKQTYARNKKAFFDYEIGKKYTAGILLKGYEVKSIRQGSANLKDSFIRIKNFEAWLINMYIPLYGHAFVKEYNPRRERKLLMNKKELKELLIAQDAKNMSIIPLEIYPAGKMIKVRIGTGKGRRKIDKRSKLKEKDLKRQLETELSGRVSF